MGETVWRKFGSTNNLEGLEFDDTQNIHLLAPGHDVLARGFNNDLFTNIGTSFAAPHVTGAAALLQQYGFQQNGSGNPRFTDLYLRHEVVKAVMMNSADKLSSVQGSTRTIIDSADQNWTMSEAYNNPNIPLDDEMGAGHLNVRRAVQQLAPGEYDPGMVPLIAWDYSPMPFAGTSTEYILDQPLSANQYVAATLIWDRQVESTGGNSYNEGDLFFSSGFPNLDLQLTTIGGTVVASSNSTDMNFEHIFTNDIAAGNYKLVVNRVCCDGFDEGDYALAWWIGDATTPLTGDYNGDGFVDAADYTVWRDAFESGGSLLNDPTPEGVDEDDYDYWRDNFGMTAPTGTGAGAAGHLAPGESPGANSAVPEPATIVLLGLGMMTLLATRRRKAGRPPVAQ
jgi:hypothetical protein